jgi:hypothetical protein
MVFVLWPFFRYYVDPDAISYLTIVTQYIKGDYAHAINAFWSPMGCWLTALLVKMTGWPLFASAIVVNTLPAAGMVMAGQLLFHKFRKNHWERWCFGLMSAGFWTYTVYFQSFTDIWQFFFLTLGLLVLMGERFTRKPGLWVLAGVLGALAYFGKAYSFYFFPLMILLVTLLRLRAEERLKLTRLAGICLVAVGVMMLCVFPWIYLIHDKYGIWTSSTAGNLNMSWWLVGTQEFRAGVKALVPPPYEGSLFYFEDPYLVQGPVAHFWDSPRMFAKQLARTGFNFIGWVSSASRISTFYFLTWILSILLVLKKRNTFFRTLPIKIVVLVFLVFPLPYWLLTFDGGRYLWFTIPLCSILALAFADNFLFPRISVKLRQLFTAVFFLSFLISPVSDMKGMLRAGYGEKEMADQLQQLGIKGSFLTNRSYADGAAGTIRLAWFSQNPWYCHTLNRYSTAELLRDAARYKVKYYFYFYNGTGDDYVLNDNKGRALPDLTRGKIPGLKVYRIDGMDHRP